MEIRGTTRVCGLIGNPVGHSLSPLIHNTLADLLNMDMVYTTFQVESGCVETAVQGAYALNILGLNVTVPHKQAVMGALADIDELAKAIGAVNTLVRTPQGYKGYNTDILGLDRQMRDAGIDIKEKNCVILGAGGAARAIAFLCADKGADSVFVLNRTVQKAEDIADSANTYFGRNVVKALAIDCFADLPVQDYVVIQATSVGLYPNVQDVIIEDGTFYERAAAGIDIVYNPAETEFMRRMRFAGKPAFNGMKMLMYQAIAAFELYNGISVPKEAAQKVYELLERNFQNT